MSWYIQLHMPITDTPVANNYNVVANNCEF